MVRVLIVDDSHFTQEQVASYLEEAGHSVVGKARTGKQALAKLRDEEPDVVTMDLKMPGIDGIETVRRVMDEQPTPIVMVSRFTAEGAEPTMEALEAGAVDFFHKPGEEPTTDLYQYKAELVETIEDAATVQSEALTARKQSATGPVGVPTDFESEHPTLVIASSTGGPNVLQNHIQGLPLDAEFRVVVVQHLREAFTEQFADDLDAVSAYTVRESTDGGRVGPGEMVVAHGGSHLEVVDDDGTHLTLSHTDEPADSPVQPAADVTMTSLADVARGTPIAAVMTGLGEDGIEGAAAVANAGGTVLAQEPSSSPAPSMPQQAIDSGIVDHVCPASEFVGTVLTAAGPEPEVQPVIALHTAGDNRRVLHVDDEAGALATTRNYFERFHEDIDLETTTDPADAVERLREDPDAFDCLLCDYEMPAMDGLAVLERLRTADVTTPFILYTGKGSGAVEREAREAGVDDYVEKGEGLDHLESLAERIERAVAHE